MQHSFPDLTHPTAIDNGGDESFWPSFTDIMMVVVMIFLISTASLIIKNWGLTQELTNTIESEQDARQAVQITLEENMTLEERLAALEQLLSVTQLSKMRTEEEKLALRKQLEQLTEDLARSTDISATLEARLNSKTDEIKETLEKLSLLEKELEQVKSEVDIQERKLALSQDNLSDAKNTINTLEALQAQRQKEIATAKTESDITEEKLSRLRDEYTALESKYNKLVRPARTAKGKFVVSLRYKKTDTVSSIELKTADENAFRTVSENQMHRQLAALKERLEDKLYIRIIFPEENKLSYKEAWQFTTDILNKYDYYHQNNEDGSDP